MLQGRALRHASLLLLFFALLIIGLVHENPLDRDDGAYADDNRELRDGGVPLSALLHTPAYWRAVPLTLDRRTFPFVTDAFVREYITRTAPPQLADVVDNHTLLSDDFYEELQLWRRPGNAAARVQQAVVAQTEAERVAARAAARAQRGAKSWKTRQTPAPSRLSRLWPSFLRLSADGEQGDDEASDDTAGRTDFVEVRYSANILYHGKSDLESARRRSFLKRESAEEGSALRGVKSLFRYEAVSLRTDEVQLVPFPFVPYGSATIREPAGVAASPVDTDLENDGSKAKTSTDEAAPAITVRVKKGKLRYTVPRRTTAHTPTHGWDHFYIALNLWKNEDVITDLTDALVAFLEDEVKPFFNLATAVVVAVYANVSPDRTAELIERVLLPRLHAVGVRTVYATTEGACLGYVERHAFHERIEWMACIRNKALAPLYEHGMDVFRLPTHAAPNASDHEHSMKNINSNAVNGTMNRLEGQRNAEGDSYPTLSSDGLVVLFFNDIFFRPQDITTLLESRAESQMQAKVRPQGWLTTVPPSQLTSASPVHPPAAPTTTATEVPTSATVADSKRRAVLLGDIGDGSAGKPSEMSLPQQQVPQEDVNRRMDKVAGVLGEKDAAATASTARGSSGGTTFDMACGMDFYFTFYDTWVTRDRLGNPFEAQMPYSDDHATQAAFYRIFNHDLGSRSLRSAAPSAAAPAFSPETSAVPVKCCWNGVAAIRGRFFLAPTAQHRQGFPAGTRSPLAAKAKDEAKKNRGMNEKINGHAGNSGAAAEGSSHRDSGDGGSDDAPPRALRRPSGAVYDLVGSVHDAARRAGVAGYYARVLARRLQSERLAWNRTRREIAELTNHPFYKPVVYANTSSFVALLQAVLKDGAHKPLPGDVLSVEELEELTGMSWLPSTAAAPAPVGRAATGVQDDSAYYVARYPAVRFRHAFTPSYGATVNGLKPVRDDVCLSSECLLICQDVMQAAILQDQRAPLILLNPHVRVAYDLDHFTRITKHTWFFEHPYVYWVWVMARRAQLWWTTGSTKGYSDAGAGPSSSGESTNDAAAAAAAVSTARPLASAEVRELGAATSAADDWMRDADSATSSAAAAAELTTATARSTAKRQALRIEDGHGRLLEAGVADIPTLTRMTCQRITAGSIGLAVGAFFPLLRLCQLLLVALLLRWLCWGTQADLVAKLHANLNYSEGNVNADGGWISGSGSAVFPSPSPSASPPFVPNAVYKSLTVEERWWWSVYNVVWYNRVVRRVQRWLNAASAPSGLDDVPRRSSSGGSSNNSAAMYNNTNNSIANIEGGAAELAGSGEAFYMRRHPSPNRVGSSHNNNNNNAPAANTPTFNNSNNSVLSSSGGGTRGGMSGAGGSGASTPLPPVPFLHLQLRQYYRRRKVAATLGSCAHRSRRAAQQLTRTVLWLLGTLCCVRFWCGCHPPTPPPAPGCCADSQCAAVWDTYVAGAATTPTAAAANGRERKNNNNNNINNSLSTINNAYSGGGQRTNPQMRFDVSPPSSEKGGGGWQRNLTSPLQYNPSGYNAFAQQQQQQQQQLRVDCGENNFPNSTSYPTNTRHGSRLSSPGQSVVSTQQTDIFYESGSEGAVRWPWGQQQFFHDQQQQQQQQQRQQQLRPSRLSPWPMSSSSTYTPESSFPHSYATSVAATATYSANPLVSPLAAATDGHADSPFIAAADVAATPLVEAAPIRCDVGPHGGALQSVRSRNTSARSFGPYSPDSPALHHLSGAGEASVQNV